MISQGAVHFSVELLHEHFGQFLVGNAVDQRVFQRVREGAVADVVEENGHLDRFRFLRRNGMALALKNRNGPLHQMHRPQRVVKPRVVRAGIDERAQAQLANAAQALEGGVFDQVKNPFAGYRNETVDWIVEEFELVGFDAVCHSRAIGAVNLTYILWTKRAFFG